VKFGFIGAGNMGGAIIKGYAAAQAVDANKRYPDALLVFDEMREKAEALAHLPAVNITENLAQLWGLSDCIVLCVKPNAMETVLDEIVRIRAQAPGMVGADGAEPPADPKLYISIAAGVSLAFLQNKLGGGARCVRVMPNTPAMVGEGMSALSAGRDLKEAEAAAVEGLFSAVGKAVWIPESLMDIVTGISGSSPAYAYLYMEGLIRAGTEGGLSREAATLFAAQSTLGAAKMVLENRGELQPDGTRAGGTSPEQLRINVCSPGGTTIEAVKALESANFRDAVESAVRAATNKSRLMTK